MKSKLCLLISLFVVGCLLPSCKTYQHTSRTADIQQRGITAHQMSADMRVDFAVKVNGESRKDCLTRKEAIENALNSAIAAAHVDVVIDPIYEVEVHRKFGRFHYYAKVTGYAGYYTKVETVDEIDKEVQRVSSLSMDDIVKYKLLTDPNFVDQYYQRDMIDNSNRTTIYFNNGNGNQSVGAGVPVLAAPRSNAAAPAQSLMIQKAPKQPKSPRTFDQQLTSALKLRNTGIGLVSVGAVMMFPIGIPCLLAKDQYYSGGRVYYEPNIAAVDAGIAMMTIGGASAIVGIVCASVGGVKANKLKNSGLAIAPSTQGLGLKLQF